MTNPEGHKGESDSLTFLKLAGSVIGALSGFAALFIAFGYITLQSFLSWMSIYGLAYFPTQLYKEASITFLRDILRYYSSRYYFLLIAILILLVPFLIGIPLRSYAGQRASNEPRQPSRAKKRFAVFFLVLIVVIAFLPFSMLFRGDKAAMESVFFAVSVPTLVALFLHLACDYVRFDRKRPLTGSYVPFLIVFIVLCLSIPIGYGYFFYDISVFTVSVPQSATPIAAFERSRIGGYQLLYLMGHASEREVFIDATRTPINIILVDKKLIAAVKVDLSRVQNHSLRKLLEGEVTVGPQEENIKLMIPPRGKEKAVTRDELVDWMKTKDDQAPSGEIKK